jgi:hypothetical protein
MEGESWFETISVSFVVLAAITKSAQIPFSTAKSQGDFGKGPSANV